MWRRDLQRVTIPPGVHNRLYLLESLARTLGARLRWPADVAGDTVDVAITNVPIEQALTRLLDGFDWTVVWESDHLPDGIKWRPVEIRVGAVSRMPLASDDASLHVTDAIGEDVDALFERLRRATDDRQRIAISHLIAKSCTNQAAAHTLLTVWVNTEEAEDIRAIAIATLSQVADAPLLREIEQEYRDRGDPTAYGLVLEVLRRCQSETAVSALIEWAEDIATQPASPRARAALQGLACVGTAPSVDFLLDRYESVPAEARDAVREALLAIAPTAPALAALRFAAEGRRGIEQEDARLTALNSLARFPDSLTVAMVVRLAVVDPSPIIRARAAELAHAWTHGGR